MFKDDDEVYRPDEGKMPWEYGHYGTASGSSIGLHEDESYEIIGHGCYRRQPANPGSE